MTIVHVFLRIIALLQTPRPDPEGSMAGIMRAWTLEHQVGIRHECHLNTCWLFPRLAQNGDEREREVTQLCPTLCDPVDCSLPVLCPWDFPGKNTGEGCHFLLQEIFPTQRLNVGLLHCRQTLYCLSHQGSLWG